MTDDEKRSRLYEEQVFPLIGRRLVERLVEDAPVKPRLQALQIRCGLGESTTGLLHRLDRTPAGSPKWKARMARGTGPAPRGG